MSAVIPAPNCNDVRDLLGAFALSALDPDETLAVERHLDLCPPCREASFDFERVSSSLATLPRPAPPPPDLRARLLAEAATRPAPTPTGAPPRSRARFVAPRWTTAVLAAAAVVLLVATAVLAALLDEARGDRDQALAAERKLTHYLSAGGSVTRLTALPDADYGATTGRGSLVTAPGMAPLVVVGGCPPSSDDRHYRVWLARGDDRTGVGELEVGQDGAGWLEMTSTEPLESFETIGITVVGGAGRQDLLVGPVPSSDA